MGDNKPGRYTKNSKWSIETGAWAFIVAILWKPLGAPCLSAVKAALPLRSLKYHPAALAGVAFLVWRYTVHPLAPLWIMAALVVGVGGCMIRYPDFYRKHLDPRIKGVFWGIRCRYELREKLVGCRIIKETEGTPIWVRTRVIGCTVKAQLKMIYGDKVDFYRQAADTLAPAFNAQDCKVRKVWKNGELQPKRVELELLARNPFKRPVGVEFIDFHLDPANPLPLEGNVTSMHRDGKGYALAEGRHELVVGETGSGKSNYLRARMYANHLAVQAKLLEVWGADGGGGVEISYMEHLFARTCYGDGKDLDEFNGAEFGEAFAQFFEDVVRIMIRRLKGLRGDDVVHIPTPEAPALEVIVDELLAFDSTFVQPAHRRRIYSSMELVQRQGRKARIRIVGCAQDANMEDLPIRRGFTDRRVYRVKEAIQVDMAAGRGVWERGAKSDEIPVWQQGTSYVEQEGGTTPEQIRDAYVSNADIKALPPAPASVLWHEPEPVEEVFVSLPVEPVPVADEVAEVPRSRRLHLNSSRRPASTVRPNPIPFVDEPPGEPSEFEVYEPPPPSSNGNGNGHHSERVEEEMLR